MLHPIHSILDREALVVVLLGETNRIIDMDVRMGDRTSVSCPSDEILDLAINRQATKVTVGHNHPGNRTTPSDQDVYHCSSLHVLLCSNGIQLIDDLVLCGAQLKSVMNTLRFKQMVKNY
jgi:DNA repair protein RadC